MKHKGIIESERGSVSVLVTFMMVVIVIVLGMVIDIGYAFSEKQQLQNAVDAAALAGAQELPNINNAMNKAYELAALNGLQQSQVQVKFSDGNRKIIVESTKKINFSFFSILDIFNVDINRRAGASFVAHKIFDYTLFSESSKTELKLNGNNMLVDGTVHTNDDLEVNGHDIKVTGMSEAVKKIKVNGSKIDIPYRVPNASYIDIPDYTSEIKQQAEAAGQVFKSSKTYNGNAIYVDNSIYVKGEVHLNGNSIVGTGALLAKDDIHLNGNMIKQSTDDAICIYSQKDIKVNGNDIEINGILYAPDGEITLNGNNITIHGKVIGNTVKLNGNSISIIDDNIASYVFPATIKLVE